MRAELKWSTTENGKRFVIMVGTRKRRKLCVECLDFQTCCATPKGKYNTVVYVTLENFRFVDLIRYFLPVVKVKTCISFTGLS